jgi:hypothetical protein
MPDSQTTSSTALEGLKSALEPLHQEAVRRKFAQSWPNLKEALDPLVWQAIDNYT